MDQLPTITKEIIFLFNEQKLLILKELFGCPNEKCGCDLKEKLGITKDLLSYHIKSLRELGYLEEAKCGQRKRYSITQDKYQTVKEVLKTAKLI